MNATAEIASAGTVRSADAPFMEMRGIVKRFGGVPVLLGVEFDLRRGEVHALVGENGAGKSTLMKILGGVHRADAGEIWLDGQRLECASPREAARCGIALIHQELSLVPNMSVAENVMLGREPVTRWGRLDRRHMEREARRWLAELEVELDVRAPVEEFGIGMQQLIEIAKALSLQTRVLVMDEPTSALTEQDAQRLFRIIGRLKATGVGVIYISHKLEEIYRVADRITVLRDGARIGTEAASRLPQARMIEWMVGRRVDQFFPSHGARVGDELLRVEGFTLRSPVTGRPLFADVSLAVRAGEIVGLGGLMGSGGSYLLEAMFGRYGRVDGGRLWVAGREVDEFSPAASLARGVALLTSDRKATGLVLPLPVLDNMTLASLRRLVTRGWLSRRREQQAARPMVDRLRIRLQDLAQEVSTLSGGNQQKVLFARWLLTDPRVFLLDEPTRGVDVGAKSEIYELMHRWTEEGRAILLISSELPELLAMSDRIVVLHRGRVTAELDRGEATEERVMAAAMGDAEGPVRAAGPQGVAP